MAELRGNVVFCGRRVAELPENVRFNSGGWVLLTNYPPPTMTTCALFLGRIRLLTRPLPLLNAGIKNGQHLGPQHRPASREFLWGRTEQVSMLCSHNVLPPYPPRGPPFLGAQSRVTWVVQVPLIPFWMTPTASPITLPRLAKGLGRTVKAAGN